MKPANLAASLSNDREMILGDVYEFDGVLGMDLHYPPKQPELGRIHAIQIGLMAVRAADDIRISYDYERNGWKIEQEASIAREGCNESTGDWVEVAFVQAWGSERQLE